MKNIQIENILEEAYELYLQGDYKASLQKYQWFFDNAENINTNYDGAKYRSLQEWYCLSQKYVPAYEALIQRKKSTYLLFMKNKSLKAFNDYVKICETLKLDTEAIHLFLIIQETDMDFTKKAYLFMESILINNKKWELCNLYIDDSIKKYKDILAIFDELMNISKNAFNGEYNAIYEKKFENDIQNLFKILEFGKRKDEINNILISLKKDMNERNISIEE